jgi:hypothetical protein
MKFFLKTILLTVLLSSCSSSQKPQASTVDESSVYYNNLTKTLFWTHVENASNGYTIEILSFPKQIFTSVSPSLYFPTESSFDIRIKTNSFGEFSDSNFTNTISIVFLQTPSNLRVVDGTLFWDSVLNANGYEVVEETTSRTITTTVNRLELDTAGVTLTYKVRAIGDNSRIISSLYTLPLSFSLLLTPSNVEYDRNANLITWSSVTGASGYKILINDASTILSPNNTTLFFRPDLGDYDIKVIALSESSTVYNSIPAKLSLRKLPTINVSSLLLQETISNDVKISFNEIQGFSNTQISYKVFVNGIELQGVQSLNSRVEISYTFSPGDNLIQITTIAPITPLVSDGVRIYLFDSEPLSFTTNKLLTPSNLRIQDGKFVWDEVANASKYQLNIGGALIESSTNQTEFTNHPDQGGNFVARIRSLGNQGNFISSDFSTNFSFRILPQIDSNQFTLNNDILQWPVVQGAIGYSVYINDVETITSTNSINFQTSLAESFVVQIRALGNNNLSVLSSKLSNPYTVSRLNTPLNFSLNVSGELTWNSVSEARRYVIVLNNEYLYSDVNSYNLNNKIGPDQQFTVFIFAESNQGSLNPKLNSNPTSIISGRRLGNPSNIRIDGSEIKWNAVPNANAYRVVLNGVTTTVTATQDPSFTPNLTSSNSNNLITITALSNSQGTTNSFFINSQGIPFTFASSRLSTPTRPEISKVKVDGIDYLRIQFNPITNAQYYLVTIGGVSVQTTINIFDYPYPNAGVYDIYVTAIGTGVTYINSLNSLTRTVKVLPATTLSSSASGSNWILRWNAVQDAVGYQVIRRTINLSTGENVITTINLNNNFTQADVSVPSGFRYEYQIIVIGDGTNTFDSSISNTVILSN